MKLEKFFEKFDQFAAAPDAVAKMRELILDFAIDGLLRTSESGELEANDGWPKQNLGSIASLITKGSTPTSYGHQYEASGIPFVKVENISDGVINRSSMEQYISEVTHEFLKRSQLADGDILFSIAGTIGKTCVVRAGDVPANTNQALAIIRGFSASFEIPFLKMQLDSFVANKVKAKARGGAMPNVSLGDLRDLLVVVPPLDEQKRIVVKVDELMELCDRLEVQQQERETRHAALARASLARFADAPTATNLNFLFHPSYTISPADLRKSILTLAVQGKLVPQDPNDEPAEVSFPKLATAAVESDADGFPAHWLRVPLGKIGEWRGGGTPSKSRPEFWTGNLPWVSPKDMKVLHISDAQDHISPAAVEGSSVRLIPPGSLLMVVRGMILARAFPVALTMREVTINQDMKALLPSEPKTKDFLLTVLRAFEPLVLNAIERSSHGTCKLKTEFLQDVVIPMPPLAEQRRIVAKVEQLMALVDALETQLAASRATAANLLSALVAELTGSPEGRVASPGPAKPIADQPRPKPQKTTVATAKPAAQESIVSPRTLADLRKCAGLSQAAVAKAMGLNQAYISQMETGKRLITEEQMQQLNKILGSISCYELNIKK